MNYPGFTAERSLTKDHCPTPHRAPGSQGADVPFEMVTPSSHASYCRRLLRKCISGSDPRSFACDSWLITC